MPLLAIALAGCETLRGPPSSRLGVELDASARALASPEDHDRTRAAADYRRLVIRNLSRLLEDPGERPLVTLDPQTRGIGSAQEFTKLEPVTRARVTHPPFHRTGLGLPLVGRVAPSDPNAPLGGYRVPVTLFARQVAVTFRGNSPGVWCTIALWP